MGMYKSGHIRDMIRDDVPQLQLPGPHRSKTASRYGIQ